MVRCTLLSLLLLLAAGCGPEVIVDAEAFTGARVRTLALLPFTLDGPEREPRAREKVDLLRDLIHRRLTPSPYLLLDDDVVDQRLRAAGFASPIAAANADFRALRRALGVDGVVRGKVTTLYNLQLGVLFRQAVIAELTLVDTASGRPLVRIAHGESLTGGIALEWGQAVDAIEGTVDNATQRGYEQIAAAFAETVARSLPPPLDVVAPDPPTIEAAGIATTRPSGVLAVGDALEVRVEGTPGVEATLTLGLAKLHVPLIEEAPGRYWARYEITPGDAFHGQALVSLRDPFGLSTGYLLPLRLTLDGTPPGAARWLRARPARLEDPAAARRGALELTWAAPEGEPAARYRVFAVEPAGGVRLLSEVAGRRATVRPGEATRLAVGALDEAGNLGPLALLELGSGAEAP